MPSPSDKETLLVPLLLLTIVTGFVDAASVLALGHVFTANMTGNVVFLGFALGGSHDVSIAASLVALGGFLLGALCGGRVVSKDARATLPFILALEIILLVCATGVAAFTDPRGALARGVLLVLLSMPMGLQNAAVRRLAVADMTTTVLTLTLTGIAADSSLAGGDNARIGRRCAAVAAMLGGALLGAVLLRYGLAWTIAAAALGDATALAAVLAQKDQRDGVNDRSRVWWRRGASPLLLPRWGFGSRR
jgi:uncharacterized membrane protein YoaK (UPF0700 family)